MTSLQLERPSDLASATQIVLDACRTAQERRTTGRIAYVRPALIRLGDDDPQPVFTRDVSDNGIGLLHLDAIDPQQAVLSVELESGVMADVSIDVLWCERCGNGWHISGGDFRQ